MNGCKVVPKDGATPKSGLLASSPKGSRRKGFGRWRKAAPILLTQSAPFHLDGDRSQDVALAITTQITSGTS
jgi:hypothetical protein